MGGSRLGDDPCVHYLVSVYLPTKLGASLPPQTDPLLRLMSETWDLEYLLPNLALPARTPERSAVANDSDLTKWGLTLETEHIAIVPPEDPRVSAITDRMPAAKKLISSFRDSSGRRARPAVLIVRRDAPLLERDGPEPIVSFRNAIAFSIILRARAQMLGEGGLREPTWSDTFDFHPAFVNRRGSLVASSPALVASHTHGDRYLAMPSPHIPVEGERLTVDRFLYRSFAREWKRRYSVPVRKERFGRVLFRALEMAYQASSVAMKNQGSLNEYGIQVALWVSALEILAWPMRRHASESIVLDLLGEYRWRDAALNRKAFRGIVNKKRRSLNAVQKICNAMYSARNGFLHGNPVHSGDLFPFGMKRGVPLTAASAIVFRTALAVHLAARHEIPFRTMRDLLPHVLESFDDFAYERALRKVILSS